MFAASKTASLSGYQIQRSLRFNSADSAYLSRTFGTPTANLTWTLSLWVKLTALSTYRTILSAGTTEIGFSNGNAIWLVAGATTNTSTAIYRDPSAWGHLVISSNGTTMNAYWNNSNVLSAAMTMPQINSAAAHTIGKYAPISADLFDGYMTEVNFIDGQALTPSSFGQTNANTGVWEPKPYAGTYGTNGFYLNFSDNSNTTATTLGKDYSGNGNNWTPNNFSVSAGAGNDSLVDVPTAWGTDTGVGGTVRGNYCTWNPLSNLSGQMTLTNGNLDAAGQTNATWQSCFGTLAMPTSGKWYFEVTINVAAQTMIGITRSDAPASASNDFTGSTVYGYEYYSNTGNKYNSGSSSAYGASYTSGDVIGVAFDADNGTLAFYKNGTSQGTAYTGLTGYSYFPTMSSLLLTSPHSANFGQRPFAYTAPSGFKALCTQNLPTPTIGATASTQANRYFDATLFTGTGSPLTVVNAGGFQPDLVWTKNRSSVAAHYLTNVLSGVSQYLSSDSTSAELTGTQLYTSFNSNGFSMGTSGYPNGAAVVAWQWKANGAGVTNTAGSITSTVSANTTSGFSVVTFTSQASGTATVGHGLGAAPKMVIVKGRNVAYEWYTYHASLGASAYVSLSNTAASASSTTLWNATSPTSSVFSLGTAWTGSNTFVAYCFAEVPGFSKFGSYTGNGSTDGPFVYCGFRPAYVMIKATAGTDGWAIQDATRFPSNEITQILVANSSGSESSFSSDFKVDFLANGFKVRNISSAQNTNGTTYIFAAFASAPQKFALAR